MGEIFVGRLAERDRLRDRLVKSANTVLSGEAGVGKSSLVKIVINDLVGEKNEWLAGSPYPDGIVFLDARSNGIDIEKIWHQLADQLNGRDFMEYASAQERATFACNGKHFLLVLDIVEILGDDPVCAAVATILKVFAPENRYLILTRSAQFDLHTLRQFDSYTLRLSPLSTQDADALLYFI